MEEKKDSCCSSGCSCCSSVKKFVVGALLGVFIFAAGMWFAKSCPMVKTGGAMCPMSGPKAN